MTCPNHRAAASAVALCVSTFASATAVAGQDLLVLDDQNRVFRVTIAADGDVSDPADPITVTGLGSGEEIASITIDPATGNLFAYSTSTHCYIVDKTTGVATDLGSLPISQTDTARFIDVQPVSGNLRVQGSEATNLELDPETLAIQVVGFAPGYVDGDPNEGVAPMLAGSAFTNNFPGSSATQGLALDSAADSFSYYSALNGQLFTIGDLGVDSSLDAGLAIDLSNRIVAVIRPEGDTESRVYFIAEWTGAATEIATLTGMVSRDVVFDLDPTSDDIDGDGWPNDVELAGASNFVDPNSIPFPNATKVPPKVNAPALAQKLRVRLEFDDSGDRIVVKGKMPVGESTFDPTGRTLIVDVGGVATFFVLNAKGRGTSAEGYEIDFESKVGLGGVRFKLAMEGGAFQSHLADEGLTETDVAGAPSTIPVDFWMSNLHAHVDFHASYSATSGAFGIAK